MPTCVNCKKIIRNSKYFCNIKCHNNYTTSRTIKNSSINTPVVTPIKPTNSPIITNSPVIIKPPNNKSCTYCFDSFDANINPGVVYKTLWFCSQNHLDLANPRPKVVFGMPPIIHHPGFPLIPTQMIMPNGIWYPAMNPYVYFH